MRIFLLLLIGIFSYLCASSYTTTENDPSTLVEGVSVITGKLYVGEEDYVVAGAEPIAKRRYYLSGYGGIDQYPHLLATFLPCFNQLHVCESNGTPVVYYADPSNQNTAQIGNHFYGKKKRAAKYSSAKFADLKGVTNTAKGSISAQSQLKNQSIIFEPNRDPKGKSFCLHAADGTVRRYVNVFDQKKAEIGPGVKAHMDYYYKLESETLPNGHVRHYDWTEKNQLYAIRTTNRQNNKVFSRIELPQIEPGKMYLSHRLTGTDGRSVSYEFRRTGKNQSELAKVESPDFADMSYFYVPSDGCPLLTEIALPKGHKYKVNYESGGERRVEALSLPMGKQGELVAIHRFQYEDKKSFCFDANNNKTIYFWDDGYRLTRIERYEGDRSLKNIETFVWNGANLRCKALLDAQEKPLFARTFECDSVGNLLKETFWGNLSGKGSVLHLGRDGLPIDDGVEKAIWNNSFTNDGRNLLLKHEEPGGLVTEYEYLSDAHLVKSKFLSFQDKLLQRTFSIYNEDFILVREIVDDGSARNPNDFTDVSARTIREITPRQSQPYIGLPEWIEEKYWDGQKEHSLGKTKLHYGNGATITQRDIYDANGTFRYSLTYKYDSKSRLTQETNALGQTAFYEYDEVGNKVLEIPFDGRTKTVFSYDLANRLIKKEIIGSDDVRQEFHYAWNHKHELILETDPYGNETTFEYNAFGKRTKTTFPKTQTGVATTTSNYDSAGNEILKIDPEGNQTQTSYTAWGKPIQILHPDGTIDENQFYLDGNLAKSIDPDGIETTYHYDALGHLIQKTTLSSTETYHYRADRLISKTDPEGHTTTYSYDGAGRKIGEEIAGEKIAFTYDELGRIHQQIEKDLILQYTYDLLGRLTKTQTFDASGELLRQIEYEYDPAGNPSKTIRSVDGKQAIEQFEYDSLHRLIKKTNPIGSVETTQFEIVENRLNQKVLKTTHIDPLGLQTIDVYDALNRVATSEKKKSQSLFLSEKTYDLAGRQTHQTDTIHSFDGTSRPISTSWKYDNRGRLTSLIEADNTFDRKETHYSYTSFGAIKKIIKPDGVSLTYEYNNLRQNTKVSSSDGTVQHEMTYNLLGHLTSTDGIRREVDPRGRLILETHPDGRSIQTEYDAQGRKTQTKIPSADCVIEYDYRGQDLIHVSRKTLSELPLYQHTFTSYDLSGNLKQETLIGNLGQCSYEIDSLSRRIQIQAPQFHQQICNFDPVGNITQMRIQQNEIQYAYDDLYQLTLESGPILHQYRYDTNYNRLQKDTRSSEINALNQDLTHFVYNPNGTPSRQGDTLYFYDAFDRLIKLEAPTYIQTFIYDSLHRCLSQTTHHAGATETRKFLYDGQNEIASFNETNQLIDLRILGATPHAEIGSAIAIELRGKTFAPIHDLQGNIAALLPLDQSQPSFYRYTAFGEESIQGASISPWRFASKRTDDRTGLVNYGRRYYLPSHGRWLTPDPLGFTAGMNLYAFVHNNPLTHLDDYGLIDRTYRERSMEIISNIYNSPRFQGGLQAFGGLVEIGIGAGATYLTGGAAAPIGWATLTHGLDHFFTGVKSAYYGRPLPTVTNQLLQKAGASPEVASFIDNGSSMALTMGSTAAVNAGRYIYHLRSFKIADQFNSLTKAPSKKALLNFTGTAGQHMFEVERKVPIHILDSIIKSPMAAMKDPQGVSNAMMYYSQLWKNGKLYNIEVLYEKYTNTVFHFQYTQKPIGPLKRISKCTKELISEDSINL